MPNESLSPPRRLKLIVAYDGAGFDGWQSQRHGNTIQDCLEEAFAKVSGKKIRVHGASRTDAGVHALGQCAHADVAVVRLNAETWRNALNASLPPQIRVLDCRFVRQTFHARFSARGKVYRYRIATTPVLSPLELGRAWHVFSPLDDARLRECAALFTGQHDFAGFAANRGHPPESTVRTLQRVIVRRTKTATTVDFEGNGFLYKMARLLVGTMVRCAAGKISVDEVQRCLTNSSARPPRFVAPAGGLTLLRVRY